MDFSLALLNWYKRHKRELPWRNSFDPFKIWLSEIILQQTRVNQGLGYYYRFLEKFPDLPSLARAPQDQVLALWQGLGYYSRARNLHHTAQILVQEHNGIFPANVKQLRQLPGIGSYTAAAIASMAFSIPVAAVDGNVTRVLARYFAIEEPVDEPKTRKAIEQIANEIIDPLHPGEFNQALMDLGSSLCKPLSPDCLQCPLSLGCLARITSRTHTIPLKRKKTQKRDRFLHYFFLWFEEETIGTIIQKRAGNDIWKNLYQLPLVESEILTPPLLHEHKIVGRLAEPDIEQLLMVKPVTFIHHLTHQRLTVSFYRHKVTPEGWENLGDDFIKTTLPAFDLMGKPIVIHRYLQQIIPTLE